MTKPAHDATSNGSQFLDSVMAYMEQRIAGYQQRGDSIFNGSIMAEELQEWLNRLRSCVPSAIPTPSKDDIMAGIERDICELDYTSPVERPDELTVSVNQLRAILERHIP